MTSKDKQTIREIAILFANRIGSPYGEGATYDRSQAEADEDDKPSANGKLWSHLDDDDFELFVDDLTKAIQSERVQAQREEVERFGGKSLHAVDVGSFCRKGGEQFRPCLQCLKEERLADLQRGQEGDK